MTLTDILADYRASLNDSASLFTSPDYGDLKRHLWRAAQALGTKRHNTSHATLTLTVGVMYYTDVPADLVSVAGVEWPTAEQFAPWKGAEHDFPAPPRLTVTRLGGARNLYVRPWPTRAMVDAVNGTLTYTYVQAFALGATDEETTLPEADKWLLILRAQVEAMRELSMRSHMKPVQLRGMQSSNMQPSALYELLLKEFEAAP